LTHKSGIAREAGGRELKDEAKERRKKGERKGKGWSGERFGFRKDISPIPQNAAFG